MARSGGTGLVGSGRVSAGAGNWWVVASRVAGLASELNAFDKSVQAPVNFTQTAFDRSLVIFGELSHKFVPSCCRNLLSGGKEEREDGRQEGAQWRTGTEPGWEGGF